MMKKGHKRKNWTERWFMLKPNSISYYVGEDLTDQKGDILLDGNCTVEARSHFFYENSSTCLISETSVYIISAISPATDTIYVHNWCLMGG